MRLPQALRGLTKLLHALVRQTQEIRDIANAEAKLVDQPMHGVARGRARGITGGCQPMPRIAAPPYGGGGVMRNPNVVRQFGCIRILDPQPEYPPNASSRLDEAATVRVASGDGRHSRNPSAAFIPLQDDAIPLHRSHLAPRHGSRSRSIARTVPGGRSTPR